MLPDSPLHTRCGTQGVGGVKFGSAFAQTLVSQLLQSSASIVTGVLIARGLGPAGQGWYATFAAGVGLGAFLASLGQFHGNVLAVASSGVSPRLLVGRSVAHGIAVLAVSSALILLWHRFIAPAAPAFVFSVFAVVLTLESVAEMVRGINLGQHHVTAWNVVSLTQRFVYCAAVVLLFVTLRLRLELVVVGWALATFASVVASIVWVWRRTSAHSLRLSDIWQGWGARLGTGLRAFVTVGLTLLLVRADVWMLRPMLGVTTVGQISVATYLAEWLWYVPSILGNLIFAVVAADAGAETLRKVTRSARMMALLMTCVLLVLLPAGRMVVRLLYGDAYAEAGLLFVILLPGMAALAIHLIVDSYFAGRGFPPITIWGAFCALVAKVGLNIVVVPRFGAFGAAGVTSVVYMGLLALKVIWFRRTTGTRLPALLILDRSDCAYIARTIGFARAVE